MSVDVCFCVCLCGHGCNEVKLNLFMRKGRIEVKLETGMNFWNKIAAKKYLKEIGIKSTVRKGVMERERFKIINRERERERNRRGGRNIEGRQT